MSNKYPQSISIIAPFLHSEFNSLVSSILGSGMNYNIPYVKGMEKCPGFGFFPTDECLVDIFLPGKNSGQAKDHWPILEIDLCAFEPCELPGLQTVGCDNYKYFFNRRQYADERKKLVKRRTKTGYWKSTGHPRKIKGESTKRSLVFYEKGPIKGSKAVRTGWIIQEYYNGGEYVISKLQIKDDKTKKSKLRCQNILIDDFTKDNQTIYHNSEVQNVSTDDSAEDNEIHSHDIEGLYGFEDQNPKEMMVMADHNKSETTRLLALVYTNNSSSTEFGGEYQSPAISSDHEYYNQNDMTANYSTSQVSEVVLPQFEDQSWKDMNINMSAYNTGKAICQEGFSSGTENRFSNESEGEWSPITASPNNNFSNEIIFDGEGIIFSPCFVGCSLHNNLAATNLEQSDWWNPIDIFN